MSNLSDLKRWETRN